MEESRHLHDVEVIVPFRRTNEYGTPKVEPPYTMMRMGPPMVLTRLRGDTVNTRLTAPRVYTTVTLWLRREKLNSICSHGGREAGSVKVDGQVQRSD